MALLPKIRRLVAAATFIAITLLFLDFTGTLHRYLGFLAKIQFLPAVLALNIGVILAVLLITLLFGRFYCSLICPLGIMQDIIAHFGARFKGNKSGVRAQNFGLLRYVIFTIFVLLIILGLNSVATLIAPYSAYGRIAQNLLSPIYLSANNLLAYIAERADSYAFYPADIWLKSLPTFIIALFTFIIIAILAWRGGRTFCNTVCPVGTFLSLISRFSLFRPAIDKEKCVSCRLCEKRCKAAAIDIERHTIDTSRCVACLNCLADCPKGAIKYRLARGAKGAAAAPERRSFLLAIPALLFTTWARADNKTTDGGLAPLKPRKTPDRGEFSLKPAGSKSFANFSRRCTACQLCVAACPNGVLRPSSALKQLMQPEMSFDKGYCRPECTKCGEVCPAGAITQISRAEKSSIQIGHAVWEKALCLPVAEGTSCGNCARHCPNGAIEMIEIDGPSGQKVKVPAVDSERCIGCGACEYVCPVRPFSAIHVVGHEVQREI